MNSKKAKKMTQIICATMAVLMILGVLIPSVFAAEIKYTDKEGKVIKLDDFLDTRGHWAQRTLNKWAEYEIIVGHEGNFMPNKPITRGDIAVVLDRMLGLKTMSYNFFNDLSNNAYYRDAMLRNVAEGYFSGSGNNLLNPQGYATREEIAVVLCRVFKIDTSNTGQTHFFDDYTISSWARPSIYALSKLGYMNGSNNKVSPKSNITRAEVITLFDNIAEGYISRKDVNETGTTFTSNFNRNLVVARGTSLVRSTIGRDLIVTQSANNLELNQSDIKGRLILLGVSTVNIKDTMIGKIEIFGKSNISGITNNIGSIYVSETGTETILDAIPKKLYLDPGVRVRIEGVMYENLTTKIKEYDGLDIKADISSEQGSVTGGPKVSGVKYVQTQDNSIEAQTVKVTGGTSEIKEIGLIYNSGIVVPTLKNYEGIIKYTGRYQEPFTIKGEKVQGERTYRVYTKDAEGLIGYSTPETVKEFTYTTELKIYDVDYPEVLRVEVLMSGENIPDIRNIRAVYSADEKYAEEHMAIALRIEEDPNSEKKEYGKEVRRYIGEIRTPATTVGDLTVYNPPTAFGYIITYGNGSVVNQFPVITNAIPEGISPVERLVTGNARFTANGRLEIANNRVTTRHVGIQEAGVVYREVPTGSALRTPDIGKEGWVTQSAYINVGLKETSYFNVSIPVRTQEGETQFASYIKTSNGYFYGNVQKVTNDWHGTGNGPQILGTPQVMVLDETKAVVNIPVKLRSALDYDKFDSIITFTDKNGKVITNYNGMYLKSTKPYLSPSEDLLVLTFEGLGASQVYNCNIQLYDRLGETSNIFSFSIDTNNTLPISLGNRQETTKSIKYDLFMPSIGLSSEYEVLGAEIINSDVRAYVEQGNSPMQLVINGVIEGNKTVQIKFRYYIARGIGNIEIREFTRNFQIKG